MNFLIIFKAFRQVLHRIFYKYCVNFIGNVNNFEDEANQFEGILQDQMTGAFSHREIRRQKLPWIA